MIRDAADQLNINYSTAKTILRVHRLKKRILRVNKEKKFELFKVVKNDDKPDEVYRKFLLLTYLRHKSQEFFVDYRYS